MRLQQFRAHIVAKQKGIKFESDEDEGAAEYWAELEIILQAIDSGGDVAAACDWVGETCLLRGDA